MNLLSKLSAVAALCLLAVALPAAQQTIKITPPGDTLPVAGAKINANFTEVYTSVAGKQAADSDLTTIAGLSPSANDVLQFKAGAWANRSPSQLKTDLALSASDIGLANVENTALSTWAGSTNLTTLGTITSGTWAGTDVTFARIAQGSALSVLGVTGNAPADLASIVASADGQVLRRAGTAVAFGAVDLTATGATTGPLLFSKGGTNLSSAADDTTMVSSGSAWVATAIPNCTDTGGNHLNYATATNSFSCGTSGSGGGGGTTVYAASLAADSVFTTATLADRLSVSSLPAGNYSFEAWFRITQTGGGADLKLAVYSGVTPDSNNFGTLFSCSDGPTIQSIGVSPWQSGGTSPTGSAFDFSGGSQCVFTITGSIELPSTADVRLQWSQNTATGTTTISRGAWMRLIKVN